LDGYFEIVPTVWHKEVLWAMAHGIHVYGAASIGALRAAELAEFGMTGVGEIYDQFRTGVLVDDDEVALTHGPEELDYVPVCEAMVNVRATIARALALGVLPAELARAVLESAKDLFYKERSWDAVLAAAFDRGVPDDALRPFRDWLPHGVVDQKRLDALAMVQAMGEHLQRGVVPLRVGYELAPTFAWEDARARADQEADAFRD
jgi:hypothetical protein